jgi:hypothetical protein
MSPNSPTALTDREAHEIVRASGQFAVQDEPELADCFD